MNISDLDKSTSVQRWRQKSEWNWFKGELEESNQRG